MARLESIAKAGYYPTPPRVVEAIAKLLETPYTNSPVAVCDPCCGEGDALAQLIRILSERTSTKFKTYGVELSPERAEKAREKLDEVVQGDALKLYVQPRGSFGLVFLNPPYGTAGGKRLEYEFLKLATGLLAPDAPLIFIIPYYVTKNILDYWSLWYYDTICLKFPHPEFEEFKQVVLVGKRRKHRLYAPDKTEKRFLALVALLDESALRRERKGYWNTLRYALADPAEVNLPAFLIASPDPPQIFMTTEVTKEDLVEFAVKSGLHEEFFSTHAVPDPTVPFRPLMSLRQGHLIQILISGALNGRLRDEEGNEIWVKGSVWKEFREGEQSYESDKGDRRTEVKIRRERFMYAVKYWTPEGNLKKVSI